MNTVSIIIPLYNQRQFIGQAIDSLLKQTYKDIEIIVVNDGSTDDPVFELEKYKSHFKLINQQNMGLSAARNTGITHATGEYIQFLDADDFLHYDKLKVQLDFMIKIGSRISYCEINQFSDKTGKADLRYIGPLNDMFLNLYNVWVTYPLPIHSLLFKKKIFEEHGGFAVDLKAAEDRYYLSQLALKGERFDYYPFIGGGRRQHDDNMNLDRIHIYENMIKFYQRINEDKKARLYIKEHCGFSSYQMMEANLSYFFLRDIANGLSFSKLYKIKKLIRLNKIKYNCDPIPDDLGITEFSLFLFVVRRCVNKFKKIVVKVMHLIINALPCKIQTAD